MIKVLYTTPGGMPGPDGGGFNKVIYNIISKLNRTDFTGYYLSRDASSNIDLLPERQFSIKRKTGMALFNNIKSYKRAVSSYYYLILYNALKSRYYNREVEKISPAIIHSHHVMPAYYLRKTDIPLITTIHDKGSVIFDMIHDALGIKYSKKTLNRYSVMEREAIARSNIVTFPSYAAMEYFKADTGNLLEGKDVRVIYNGIEPLTAPPNPGILLKYNINNIYDGIIFNVANHIKPKKIDLILETMNILINSHNKRYLFINAGFGPELPNYLTLVNKYNLQPYVKFLGVIPNSDIRAIMNLANYFLITSEKVIFDYVILEAVNSSATIIANNTGGNREIIQHGVNGYLLNDNTTTEIVDIILNKEKLPDNTLPSKFTLSNVVNEYENLYTEVCG